MTSYTFIEWEDAYSQGFSAYMTFGTAAVNPFQYLTYDYDAWEAGYFDALREENKII